MSKLTALGMLLSILGCSLTLASACNFGGDRSLGTIDAAGGARTDAGVIVTPAAGATGGATSLVIGPPPCDPLAEQSICAQGEFCYVDFTCGRGIDRVRGYCQVRPTECGVPSGFEVVCGCDGQLHDSRCLAMRDGISITSLGNCERVPCLTKADCERFAESCVDSYGAEMRGASCLDSVCSCAGATALM